MLSRMRRILAICILFPAVLCLFAACSGGGGGGGDGDGDDNSGKKSDEAAVPAGRTSKTGLRIIHGAVRGVPIEVSVPGQLIQRAKFADLKGYAKLKPGEQTLVIERANSPGTIIQQFTATIEKKTEYTVLALGGNSSTSLAVQLIADPVERPEPGFGRFQALNALEGASGLTFTVDGTPIGPVNFGSRSAFVQLPSGAKSVTVSNSRGAQVARASFNLADRGEVTFVVTGSTGLGAVFSRVYEDLD